MLNCFGRIHERDARTDGQTPHNGIGRSCIASCGKNYAFPSEAGLRRFDSIYSSTLQCKGRTYTRYVVFVLSLAHTNTHTPSHRRGRCTVVLLWKTSNTHLTITITHNHTHLHNDERSAVVGAASKAVVTYRPTIVS